MSNKPATMPKNKRSTAEIRAIQPSDPWHRWRRGEIQMWQAVWDSLPPEQKAEV